MGDAATPPAELAVLVVDDDLTIRMLLTDAFADRGGWNVIARADGLEGPFRWLSKPFRLADLDAAVDALLGRGPEL